ncbi:MAG: XRE family transcriptional regulator [Proteobacteria bacterium]|nr:XRE family transcriptional regulator [Pseudomonadota bacterium]
MISEKDIGKKIREIRLSKGKTLEDLAKKTQFTKGYISKIENSKKGPPVSSLIRIAEALDVTISEIFGESTEPDSISVVKKDERIVIARNGTQFGYNYQALAYKYHKRRMDPYLLIRPPHHKKDICAFKHRGEEIMFVLEGKLEFCYGENKYLVEQGDCVYFDSNIEHYANNIGDTDVKTLMIIYTPENED